jgi:hypothetical protein
MIMKFYIAMKTALLSSSGLTTSGRKMSRRIESPVILINHWRWLEANGYKQQAASCKRQAASLTRKNYNVIGVYRRKKYDDKIYESKRSIKNN